MKAPLMRAFSGTAANWNAVSGLASGRASLADLGVGRVQVSLRLEPDASCLAFGGCWGIAGGEASPNSAGGRDGTEETGHHGWPRATTLLALCSKGSIAGLECAAADGRCAG